MSKLNLTDPAVIKRLMPGLRRLALFAGKSVETISFETCVELDELEAWIKQKGRPKTADIDGLEDLLSGDPLDESVVAEEKIETLEPEAEPELEAQPAAVAAPAPELRSALKRARERKAKVETDSFTGPAVVTDLPFVKQFKKPAPPPAPKPIPMKPKKKDSRLAKPDFRAVVKLLVDNPEMKAPAAMRKVGIPVGSWAAFKKRTFGLGKISSDKLAKYLKAEEVLNPARDVKGEFERTVDRIAATPTPPLNEAAVRTTFGIRSLLGKAPIGCHVCGGFTVHVRGRYPGDPLEEVCPTCLRDRMDDVRKVSAKDYGVATAAA